jgi:hypothetical protein
MHLSWSWWAVPSMVALVAAWGAAVVLLRTRPDRSVNRRLSVVLFLEGLFIACATGLLFLVDSRDAVFALGVLATASMAALIPQYLSFLAVSLQTPLVAPFRRRTALVLLTVTSIAGAGLVLLLPQHFVSEPYSPAWAPWNYQLERWGLHISQLHGATSLFGLLAAISAFSRTRPGSAARGRAKWFAIAFGIRDLYAGIFLLLYPVVRPIPVWGDFFYNPGLGAIYLLYVLLLTYGVLQAQLFDIQVRVKIALTRSTVAAMITGAFFVGSELLEDVVPVDGIILGVLAAAASVLALRPLKRVAERFAGTVMQDVEETPEYFESRKAEVYRAALDAALEDGTVTDRERRILARLREQLGISDELAERLEQEAGGERDASSDPAMAAPAGSR